MSPEEIKASLTSVELARDSRLFPLWDAAVPFPSTHEMEDPDIVTHVLIERAQKEGDHFLLETAISWHKGKYYIGWANHATMEPRTNRDHLRIRGCTSTDGIHWSEKKTWAEPPLLGSESFNHPLLCSNCGTLYGFFNSWTEEKIKTNKFSEYPVTEIFALDEETGAWRYLNASIPNFVPHNTPQRMADGNWIMGGEYYFYEAAVAISDGDNFTSWKLVIIPRPASLPLLFPETAIVVQRTRLLAVCRPYQNTESEQTLTAPVAQSLDFGKTWSPIELSNFPLDTSKPFSGLLSTGQSYLLTNSLEDRRTLLSIAVTDRNGGSFRRIWKVRHQEWPAIRLFGGYGDHSYAGYPTEWAYPVATEHEGNLYIAYSQGKEDCVLTVIPVSALAV